MGVVSGYDDLHILQFASAADAYDAYEVYEETPGVEYVQPDILYSAEPVEQTTVERDAVAMASSDNYYYKSWGYEKYKMNMDAYHEYLDDWCLKNLQPEQKPKEPRSSI